MSPLPQVLFGLGAIGAARAPDGSLAQLGQSFRRLLLRHTTRPPDEFLPGPYLPSEPVPPAVAPEVPLVSHATRTTAR
jgi:hypothetical protein